MERLPQRTMRRRHGRDACGCAKNCRGETGRRCKVRHGCGDAGEPRSIPRRRRCEICKGARASGPAAHLRRAVESQQDHQRHRRAEMDPERRRLLERVQQEAEGRHGVRPGDRVMAGLVPAIHVLATAKSETWMPGTSPGMTTLECCLDYATSFSTDY